MRAGTLLLAALLSAILLALAACSRNDDTAVPPPRSSITFLHYFTDSLSGGIDEMSQGFNNQHPALELKAISLDHEAFKTSIQDTLKTDNPPELYSYWAGARTASIVDELEPLDELWQQAGWDKAFAPSVIKAASEYRGKKYFLPLTQHYIAFFYNKKLFDQLQLQPPKTWEEFLAVCAALKARGITPIALGARDKWPAQFWFDYLLLRTAPYSFRQQLMSGEARFDDPQVRAVFARWKSLIDKGYFNSRPHPNELAWDSGANDMVFRGEAAMTLMGTWNLAYFSNNTHQWQAGKDFDFFPFPQIDPAIPTVALGPIDGIVMPKRAHDKAGAGTALRYLASAEAQRTFSRYSGALAPNLQVPDSAYSDIQRRVRKELERSPVFDFAFDLATPPPVAELGLDAFAEFLAFPDAYPEITRRLADEAAARFSATRAVKPAP
ncbi:extracellular solute-binding protein [Chitinilyticum litopenaei]|uniref:Extracellular solute-binding protein n=2 Tax=Chitinilyticum piscinae TaxID=2866724 RepID=A0A8J7K173_9NEIS|nr:extracellular solute-binding protein [Chitinilyticum piscinae]